MTKLASGKIPNTTLKALLKNLPKPSRDVVIPPGIGLDAAAIKIGDKIVTITSDPITFTDKNIAKYSVSVNINDIACLGCRPRFYTSVLLLPEGFEEARLYEIWNELVDELKKYNIDAVGGHMEVTSAVNTPVLIGQMIGEPIYKHLLDMRNAKSGDKILLWRGAALEGTALLASERYDDLSRHISPDQLDTMKSLLDDPGICIWPAAEKLLSLPGLVAMHDPTEGGVATALHELSDASGCGLRVDRRLMPILSETLQLAEIFDFNPLGLLASGSLLVVCEPGVSDDIIKQMEGERIAVIGELTADDQRIICQGDKEEALPRFDRDEILNALEKKL